VRWYYQFWERLPVVRAGLFGRGVIGVNAEGKRRLGEIPDVLGDDLAASVAFEQQQRRVVARARVRVHTPRTRADLVRRRIRSLTATEQLAQRTDAVAGGSRGPQGEAAGAGLAAARTTRADLLTVIRKDPRMALRLPAFLGITALSRRGAQRQIRAGDYTTWLRDESSRT